MSSRSANFFTDRAIQDDPYPYFDWVREQAPVWREPNYGLYIITGHPEAMAIYGDPATFPPNDPPSGTYSSCNVVSGTFVKFSSPFEGDDISDIIVKCRDELPFSDQLPSFDPPNHTAHRHLLMRLITPKRLKENEDFMWQFADHLIDRFIDEGSFEMVGAYAEPFTLTVIADLEGVPEVRPLPLPGAAVHRAPGHFPQAAGVPLRAVHRSTSRTDAGTPKRRAQRPGHGDIPRRVDPGGQGCRPPRRQSLRRRPGDDGAAPVVRAAHARRAARPPGTGAGRP